MCNIGDLDIYAVQKTRDYITPLVKEYMPYVEYRRHSYVLIIKVLHKTFHPLEVVCRYRDPHLQVGEHCSYLFNLGLNIYKSLCIKTHFMPNICDLNG